ncbi:MAG: hypothetical protein AAGA60_27265 [Cyanobacteria bacterium P01_E01_bin.42]
MFKEYNNLDAVKKAMKQIFNRCSDQKNNIDCVGFIYNRGLIIQSDNKIDQAIANSLAKNCFQTGQDSFGDTQNLTNITCMTEQDDELFAWTVVLINDTDALVFSGNLEGEEINLNVHRSCLNGYIDEMRHLAQEFRRLAV